MHVFIKKKKVGNIYTVKNKTKNTSHSWDKNKNICAGITYLKKNKPPPHTTVRNHMTCYLVVHEKVKNAGDFFSSPSKEVLIPLAALH